MLLEDINIVYLIIGFCCFYIVYKQLKTQYLKKKFNADFAPYDPNTGLLFTKNPIALIRDKAEGKLLRQIFEGFNRNGPNFRMKIVWPIFVTKDPENIKAILSTQFNDFSMGIRNLQFKPLLGDGVFTLDGHGWKQSRTLLRPNFSREKVGHTQSLEAHVQNLGKHIRKYNGNPFDIQEYFFRYTVDTATEFLFGDSLYGLMDETIGETSPVEFDGAKDFYHAFTYSQESLATRALFQGAYWLFNTPSFRKSNAIVHKFAAYYINKALNMTDEELDKNSKGGYIFLYQLVKETRNPKVLQDQLLNIMIAGRDTTAGLLTFCFYELARNPQIFEKLKQAIYNDFGTSETCDISEITFESLKKCDYLKYVINETLRMYPNVPVNFRFATKNTTLPRGGGKDGSKPVLIEKGGIVNYAISATHRDPLYYGKDADVFRPERWADKNLKPGWAYLPFNGGPRICLGQQFALTEASYTIVRLLQMFPNLVSEDKDGEYPPLINSQLTISLIEGNNIRMY